MDRRDKLSDVSDLVISFQARCEARAYLWALAEWPLDVAVDVLQADAVELGLLAAIGQDGVQRIMDAAFTAVYGDVPLQMAPSPPLRWSPAPLPARTLATSLIETVQWLALRHPERLEGFLVRQDPLDRLALLDIVDNIVDKTHDQRTKGSA